MYIFVIIFCITRGARRQALKILWRYSTNYLEPEELVGALDGEPRVEAVVFSDGR